MSGWGWSAVRGPALAALLCLPLAASGCSSDEPGSGTSAVDRGGDGDDELLVFAASSLAEAFEETGRRFEEANPTATVRFVLGPSDALATQINNGAPADVFASASETWMRAVHDRAPGVADEGTLAHNRLVIITPPDDPADVASLEDLGKPGVKLVLAAEHVPAGTYAREALVAAGVAEGAGANVVSNEEDVKAVVQRVALGEADAGVVYRTDLTPEVRSRVRVIEVPPAAQVSAVLQVAVIADAAQPEAARRFVAFLLGPGRAVLRSFGFLPP